MGLEFVLLFQIPCSLIVSKLISNSCVPPPPDKTLEKLKRELQILGCCRVGPMLLAGMNEKLQNTEEPLPNFFLGVDLIVFPAFTFSNFKPPPPLPPRKGSAVFFLNIGPTQTCIAIAVAPLLQMNLNKALRGRLGNAKLTVRNKV